MIKTILIVSLMILTFSCDEKEKIYTSLDVVSMMKEGDTKAGFRIADHLKYDELITKEDVPNDGLLRFHYLRAKNLGFVGLEYKTHRQAKKAAKLIKGVYFHNWAFDQVKKEPVLKAFLEKYLKVKTP